MSVISGYPDDTKQSKLNLTSTGRVENPQLVYEPGTEIISVVMILINYLVITNFMIGNQAYQLY
jgi:hypothetical protein